jgi:predicted membrane protein
MVALLICRLLISTAAEVILLVVKTAAAFAPLGQMSNPKSALPDFFIPHFTPAARNPRGAVMLLFAISCSPDLFLSAAKPALAGYAASFYLSAV